MSLYKVASILAFLIGVMSIIAGGKAMRGWDPGYSVLAWLPVYNFVMGIVTNIPAVLLWVNNRYAAISSIAVFGIHAIITVLLLTAFQGMVARQSIAAMLFRLAVWIVILVLIFIQARKT